MCLTATATGGGVTMDNIGGGTGGFTFTLNGVEQGIATVTLPVTTGHSACFANSTGALNDCGGSNIIGPGSSAVGNVVFWADALGHTLGNSNTTTFTVNTASDFLGFVTGGAARWFLLGTGHIITATDNAYDIGSGGARPRTITVGTAVSTPSLVMTGATSGTWTLTPPATTGTIAVSTAGIDANIYLAKTANYTLAATDCGSTVNLGGSTQFTLTVSAASGYPATCTVNVINTDTGRGKIMAINGVTFPNAQILWPGQSYTLKNENSAWKVMNGPGQWKITAATTFYVDTASGSDSNDCLATTTGACATLATAVARICQHFIVNARPTIQLTTGQTNAGQSLCNWTGAADPSSAGPIIQGDTTSCATAANFTIDGGATYAVIPVNVRTPWQFAGVTLASSTLGTSVEADFGSLVYLGANVRFPAVSGFHIRSFYSSLVEIVGSYCLNGAAVVHWGLGNQGQALMQPGFTITCSAAHAYTFFFQIGTNALGTMGSITFSGCGSITGQAYSIDTGGGLNTLGTTLPASLSAGSASNPGWFL